jgi:3D (Asp-Asp-Asp) domain-containing protein
MIVALSMTLVTGKVLAEDCTVICLGTAPQHVNPVNITGFFKDPAGQAIVEHQTYGGVNQTYGGTTDTGINTPNNDLAKAYQQTPPAREVILLIGK